MTIACESPFRFPRLRTDRMTDPSLPNDRDRVLAATDLVAVIGEQLRLEAKGAEFVGICPFHDDSRPSMCVVPAKGFYHCFACGAHGNAIDFLINYHRIEFREALETLAGRAGIELTRRGRRSDGEVTGRTLALRANKLAASFFARMLDAEGGAEARRIVEGRGIRPETAKRFGLGFAPAEWTALTDRVADAAASGREVDGEAVPEAEVFEAAGLLRRSSRGTFIDNFRNRLIFPIRDELGRPIAFGARKIDPEDEPKYLNSPDSEVFHKGRTLYGLDLASRAIARQRTAIVCEGYTDVIALHDHGFEHAVATLGTALTREHADRLSRFCDTVILLFDGDAAGRRAADRAVEVFFSSEVDIRLCSLPDGQDPDELLRSENGPALFQAALDESIDALMALVADFRDRMKDATGVTARQRVVDEVLRRLDGLGFEGVAGMRRNFVLGHLAEVLGVSVGMLDRGTSTAASVRPPRAVVEPDVDGSEGIEVEPATPIVRAHPRRRGAEEALLGLVLAEPGLATRPIDLGDGERAPVERFSAVEFEDPPCRAAWTSIVEGAKAGDVPDGSDLVASIDDVGVSRIVAGCFAEGYRTIRDLGPDDESHLHERLVEACRDLASAIERDVFLADREDLASQPIRTAEDAQAALARLRAAGADPASISRRRVGRPGASPPTSPGPEPDSPDSSGHGLP